MHAISIFHHNYFKMLIATGDCIQSSVYCMYRSPGRIVEADIENFLALAGSSTLSVTVQNTGSITSFYSVIIISLSPLNLYTISCDCHVLYFFLYEAGFT